VSGTALTELTGGGSPFLAGTTFDLASVGYVQAEYALDGVANAYTRTGCGVIATGRDEFSTRLLVYRPADDAAFNGTVWVEWLNVSGGLDAAPDWIFTHTELIRRGAAWVGVSAQQVGVAGGTSLLGMPGTGLIAIDPERYGALRHPGDRFSYDIFSLAGAAAARAKGTILSGLRIRHVLAMGGSQSAFRLTRYLTDIDPAAQVYDGFLVQARGGAAAPLSNGDGDGIASMRGDPVPLRDLRVPVLCVESETDLMTLGYLAARQDDDDWFRLWEIAGTAHADVYTLVAGPVDTGRLPIGELARAWQPASDILGMTFDKPVNAGPQHYVLNAAAAHLDRWVREGIRPPAAERLEVRDGAFVTDEHGNARGGIRTPHVDVPTAALSGLGNGGNPISFLSGSTMPFAAATLRELYQSPADYLKRFEEAANAAVAAGFVLPEDAAEMVATAEVNTASWQ
jgi:Alpha/beta hydrolase domain